MQNAATVQEDSSLADIDTAGRSSPPVRKARACNSCRQQKLKCDGSGPLAGPCSRCARAGLPCQFSTSFERKKAPSKSEMHRELLDLRSQLSRLQQVGASKKPRAYRKENRLSQVSSLQSPAVESLHNSVSNSRLANVLTEPLCDSSAVPTVAAETAGGRSVDGISISSDKIRDCFDSFFTHYHPMLPILEPSCSPDSFFDSSPFVFWCILITGSRRYDSDPTILDRLSPVVKRLSQETLLQTGSYISTICGLLILCTWPLPMSALMEDPSSLYAGAAMQLALQRGLHMFITQDASLHPTASRDIGRQASLGRVWAYLEFVCHCTNWTLGSPPHDITDAFDLNPYDEALKQSLPPSVFWMQEFEKNVTRATNALTSTVLSQSLGSKTQSLAVLARLFDDQIINMGRNVTGILQRKEPVPSNDSRLGDTHLPNPMIITVARIHIKSYHFFGADPEVQLVELVDLYDLACVLTQQASDIDRTSDWALYSSESYFRYLLLVAVIILRICRSHRLRYLLDVNKGERGFFAVIRLLKKRSLASADVNNNMANVLSSLWHDQGCFTQANGIDDSLSVTLSARGIFSIVDDCFRNSRQNSSGLPREPLIQQVTDATSAIASNSSLRIQPHDARELTQLDGSFQLPPLLSEPPSNFLFDVDSLQFGHDEIFWS